jgi:hypothetical protein
MYGETVLELADGARLRDLAKAPNVRAIRRPQDGKLIVLRLIDFGRDDEPALHGNSLRWSHNHETSENPVNVWTLRHIPTSARSIFGAAVNDCAA